MFDAESYEDLLKRSWSEIPEVFLLPVGTWRLRARNAVFQPPKSAESNACMLFIYDAREPQDDVNEDALAELGADYDFSENRVFGRFWLETGADWDNVRKHLAKHGVDVDNLSIEDSLKDVKGREIFAYLNQDTYTAQGGEVREKNEPSQFVSVE